MSKQDTFAKGFKGENDKPVDDTTLLKVSKAGEQQTDPTTGRVIPTREQVANEVEDLLQEYGIHLSDDNTGTPILAVTTDAVKALTAYVMQQKNDDYYRGVKLGISIGRKEAGAMFLSAFEAELGGSKVLKGVSWTATEEAIIEAAKRAVEAMVGVLEQGDSNTHSEITS